MTYYPPQQPGPQGPWGPQQQGSWDPQQQQPPQAYEYPAYDVPPPAQPYGQQPYGYGAPPPGYPYGYPPQPPKKSTGTWWILGGLASVLIVAAWTGIQWFRWSRRQTMSAAGTLPPG